MIPAFVRSSARLTDAWRFARDAHEGERRQGSTHIEHPTAAAEILHENGYPEHVVIAALLHDVIEDTSTELPELRARFGPDVCALVARLTEDEDIASYPDRKADLRNRTAAGDDTHTAAIFAADKLASIHVLNVQGTVPPPAKLEHYQRTLRALEIHHPNLPFLAALTHELRHLDGNAEAASRATECFAIDDIEAPETDANDDSLTFRVTWPTGTGFVAFDDASAVAPDQRERTWVLAWLNERVTTTTRTAVEDELRRKGGLRIT